MIDPIEDKVFDFLTERQASAADGSLLKNAVLQDTFYESLGEAEYGIRLSNGHSAFAPNDDNELEEFDGVLIVICFARVAGEDKTNRRAARLTAFNLSREVWAEFARDQTMGGRVEGARILTCQRDFDHLNSEVYAVTNLPLVVNETGEMDFQQRY